MSRDDLFSRWSERRARVSREEAEATAKPPEAPAEAELPEPQTEAEEDALLARLGLPRPEDVAGAEVRKFLAKGVPEFLRRRALRALWRSDPTFAVLDGLNDYDEDFNLPKYNQKVLATAYQVGKGIVREIEVAVTSGAEAEEAPAEEALAEVSEEGPEEVAENAVTEAEEATIADVDTEDDVPERTFAPKRMSFET